MPKTFLAVGFFLCFALFGGLNAQNNYWKAIDENEIIDSGERLITPSKYETFELDFTRMETLLSRKVNFYAQSETRISIPRPDGKLQEFKLERNGLMPVELAARYPQIQSFNAEATDGSGAWAKIDIGPLGFHAMVKQAGADTWFVDPYQYGENEHYLSFFRADRQLPPGEQQMECYFENEIKNRKRAEDTSTPFKSQAGDCMLRTYRLALSTTAEYGNFHGGTTASIMAAVVTTMNRVNGIFETDIGVTMILVGNTDLLFYSGATGSDPFTNGNGGTMLGENITECNNVIGSGNYDIGHVFSTGGGGVAYLASVCTGNKGGGVTGQGSPVGDTFDVDYVAHEMGHQYGGNHTQNNSCNRSANAAMEPGSASTIMGYAGICAPNVQNNSDDHFHAHSIAEMSSNITGGNSSSCPVISSDGNNQPSVSARTDVTIPISTPFELVAVGNDPDGDPITYCWEQMDPDVATMPPTATNTAGPAFRSNSPVTSPVRTLPNITDLVNNVSPTWEVLSSVNRHYDWRVTIRDNNPGLGCTAEDNMRVNVSSNSGPFLIEVPNTNVSWTGSTPETVNWDVAGTINAPVSCANVDILLSLDGGFTYPIVLATEVANDGSHGIIVPNNATTTARVKVICSDNIFFDISNQNFTITAPTIPDFVLSLDSPTISVCAGQATSTIVNIVGVAGFTSPVTLNVTGLPTGANWNLSTNPVSPTGTSTLTISSTASLATGDYNFNVEGSGGGEFHSISGTLLVTAAAPGAITLSNPTNGSNVAIDPSLSWNLDADASEYEINIATDAGMSTIIETATGLTGNSYNPSNLIGSATYYWTVTGSNGCGEGVASNVENFITAAIPYCESEGGTSGIEEWIETFEIDGETNNTSGADDGYGDYNAIVFNASYGQTYDVTITPGFIPDGPWNEYYRIWIDFNSDSDFEDTGEMVFESGPSTTIVTGSFTLPASGANLTTRMRVSMQYDAFAAPCGSFNWGEVEDYTIVLSSDCPDDDNDSVCNDNDICPGGNDNVDTDNDNTPDFCDTCPNSATGDSDGDGVCDDLDICAGGNDNDDADGDNTPDFCDACPNSATGDSDGDGVCDDIDICPGGYDNVDTDNDNTPDFCDD
ncbi:M12 family metallo-peptidase, partial [Chitinophagales bacterium]|nr:M12 family metallo-peptidase [Chitinophagales bacterium]